MSYYSNMSSIMVPADVAAALDELNTAAAAMGKLDLDRLAAPARLQVLQQMETARRLQVAISHDVIGSLAKEDPADVGGPVHRVIADWLLIICTSARRLLRDDGQLSQMLTL